MERQAGEGVVHPVLLLLFRSVTSKRCLTWEGPGECVVGVEYSA